MRGKLLTVRLFQFGDDPQRALEERAGVGPQFQTAFAWAASLYKGVVLSLP